MIASGPAKQIQMNPRTTAEASIPIPGGRNLSPVENRGNVRQWWDLGDRGNGTGGPVVGRKGEATGLGRGEGEGLSPAV